MQYQNSLLFTSIKIVSTEYKSWSRDLKLGKVAMTGCLLTENTVIPTNTRQQ